MAATRPMTEGDRLPWLDNRVHRRRRNLRPVLTALLGAAAFATVATFAFRYGQQSADGLEASAGQEQTVSRELPPAVALPSPPVAEPVAAPPEPKPAAVSSKRSETRPRTTRPRRARPLRREAPVDGELKKVTAAQESRTEAPKVVRTRYSGYWPTPATAVRIGRMIQIGTFSNNRRASSAWQRTVKRYPQVANLPHITSSYRAQNGRTYHRLQIMTTAPAQSQWLCRKMRADGRRCTVLGSRP